MTSAQHDLSAEPGRFIVPIRAPGAGKTTVATTFVQHYMPAVHLHLYADVFWRFVYCGGCTAVRTARHTGRTSWCSPRWYVLLPSTSPAATR